MLFRWIKNYFERRDRARWEEWRAGLEFVAQHKDVRFCQIVRVRQTARTGTKAYVIWRGKEEVMQAVWIKNCWPKKGDYVIGSGGLGHGTHHEETVFYFSAVEKVIRNKVFAGYLRYQRLRNVREDA